MTQSDAAYYQALAARDPRFDGLFFVGVTSTGIYCRPICPARTPKEANCRFFPNAMMAEKANFRPCLRCRPELAPGNAPIDDAHRIAHLIVQRIEEGLVDDSAGLEDIAAQFELSSRQIRRIVQSELGVSPIELIQTRRLLLAKQLLTETKMPVTEVAFASGFASLRRFNDAFGSRYGMPPSRLRKTAGDGEASSPAATSTLRLSYRAPYDWDGILEFLAGRTLKGVEHVTADAYMRTVAIGKSRGWIRVTHAPAKNALQVEFTHSLALALPALLGRLRNLFDLAARPDMIAERLMQDRRLKPMVKRNPGLRVPGAFDGFELATRAILGQQVTVKAATTLGCRLAAAFGEPFETPVPELTHLAPTPERLARADVDDIAKLGIVGARARCIVAVAKAVSAGELRLEAGADPDAVIARLMDMPGIGPWTAHYMAMRILRWPDAFPKEDVAVLNNLGGITPKEAEAMSQAWRPWRSYAVLHIWRNPPAKSP
ncbi:MAG TPA: AlkA N-terminal domain-containing protein [Alphaproteobacteria bacterium]|jgi:AraC family transcriptional regulator of adaptative response / DNA-3-methyladenine glycosylase II